MYLKQTLDLKHFNSMYKNWEDNGCDCDSRWGKFSISILSKCIVGSLVGQKTNILQIPKQ